MAQLLSRDQILAADDLKTEIVDMPEWGGRVAVRTMTGVERDALEAEMTEKRGNKFEVRTENYRARVVAMCLVDDAGVRLFEPADVVALGRKSAGALARVYNVAARLNGLTGKEAEALEKNSDSDQSDDSGSS